MALALMLMFRVGCCRARLYSAECKQRRNRPEVSPGILSGYISGTGRKADTHVTASKQGSR